MLLDAGFFCRFVLTQVYCGKEPCYNYLLQQYTTATVYKVMFLTTYRRTFILIKTLSHKASNIRIDALQNKVPWVHDLTWFCFTLFTQL
jgi:hypothetical protein